MIPSRFALQGHGVTQDIQGASDLFERACDGKNAKGCFFLARVFDGVVGFDGRGLPRNATKAPNHLCPSVPLSK